MFYYLPVSEEEFKSSMRTNAEANEAQPVSSNVTPAQLLYVSVEMNCDPTALRPFDCI